MITQYPKVFSLNTMTRNPLICYGWCSILISF